MTDAQTIARCIARGCMMEYGLHPLDRVNDVFVWRHTDLDAAKQVARQLAEKHHCEVVVFQIIGTFKSEVTWREDR